MKKLAIAVLAVLGIACMDNKKEEKKKLKVMKLRSNGLKKRLGNGTKSNLG